MTPTLNLLPDATPLANQVAGHQNVLSDASGSLVIKVRIGSPSHDPNQTSRFVAVDLTSPPQPALPREIAFYQLVHSAHRGSSLRRLKPFLATFYGTLRLEGRLDAHGSVDRDVLPSGEVPESVVLENVAHAFTRPSILDVKLGTVMYALDATPQKRAKMEAKAREGTSLETGMRLTGCQVSGTPPFHLPLPLQRPSHLFRAWPEIWIQTWHEPSQSYILTPKSYGKSLSPSQLPQGMIRFFPLPTDPIPSLIVPLTPPPSTATTSVASGVPPTHLPLPPSLSSPPAPATPMSASGSVTYTDHALPAHLLLHVLDILDQEIFRLVSMLESLEMRFVGSSVLVVYEGDEDRLASSVERYESRRHLESRFPDRRTVLEDDDDDGESEVDIDEESTSSDDDEDDGARADARRARRCPPLTLRLIDFAHTRLVDGEGPDEGVLKGLRTLRGLVQGRRDEVRGFMAAEGRKQEVVREESGMRRRSGG